MTEARCNFCYSARGVKEYNVGYPAEKVMKCQVCARLLGTDGRTSETDVLHAIVSLFHAMNLLPHDPDDESVIGGEKPQ